MISHLATLALAIMAFIGSVLSYNVPSQPAIEFYNQPGCPKNAISARDTAPAIRIRFNNLTELIGPTDCSGTCTNMHSSFPPGTSVKSLALVITPVELARTNCSVWNNLGCYGSLPFTYVKKGGPVDMCNDITFPGSDLEARDDSSFSFMCYTGSC